MREVISHGESALLVDFFAAEQLAEQLLAALKQPLELRDELSAAARETAQRYSIAQGVVEYVRAMNCMLERGRKKVRDNAKV